jgi:U6 snRNA-associated Sm-like protein LSm3
MNLILSDVEETIMLVDGVDGAPPGQGVVNVSLTSSWHCVLCPHITSQVAKRKMEMLFVRGDGVILVRISFTVVLPISTLLTIQVSPPSRT